MNTDLQANKKKAFSGKNIIIIVLSFIIFCLLINNPNTIKLNTLNSKTQETNYQNSLYEENLNKNSSQNQNNVDKLKDDSEKLTIKKDKLDKTNEILNDEYSKSQNFIQTINNTSNCQTIWCPQTGNTHHVQGCRTSKCNRHHTQCNQPITDCRHSCQICY